MQEGVELDLSSENCNAALRIQEEPRILCDRAEVYLTEEMYDEAVNDYRRALGTIHILRKHFQGGRGVKNVFFCLLLGPFLPLHTVRLHFYRVLLHLYRGKGVKKLQLLVTFVAMVLIKQREGGQKA